MRGLSVCLALMITLVSCDKMELSGPPDKVKMKLIYPASDAQKPDAFVIYQYDDSGNLIKESYVKYPSSLQYYYIYSYDHGLLTEKRYYLRDDHSEGPFENDIPLNETTTYTYQGNLLSGEEVMHDNQRVSAKQYFYNDDRQLVRVNTFGTSKEVVYYTEFQYDTAGNRINERNSDGSGIHYEFENNQLVRTESLSSGGSVTEITQFNYNTDGQLTERIINGTIIAQKNRYRDNNLVEEVIYHPQYLKTEWQVFRYKY